MAHRRTVGRPKGLREVQRALTEAGSSGSRARPTKETDRDGSGRQKAEEMISRLELSVGQVFPRDGGNAALLASMIQTLNGLRACSELVRPRDYHIISVVNLPI